MIRALVLAPILLALAAGPAQAVVPGKNGRIAFDSDHDSLSDIYTVNPDGSGIKRLTRSSAFEDNPAWSPDGRQIAYIRTQQLWVMNADGSGQHQVTHMKAPLQDPAWAPSGRRLIFATGDKGHNIWTVDAGGSKAQRVTNTPHAQESEPSWAPNGKRIAYSRGGTIVTADPDGGRKRVPLPKFRSTQFGPNWSPNGRQITFYNVDDDVFVMRYDGKLRRKAGFGADPSFSPDGKFIAVSDQDVEGEEGTIFARRLRGLKDFKVSPFRAHDLCENPDWQSR